MAKRGTRQVNAPLSGWFYAVAGDKENHDWCIPKYAKSRGEAFEAFELHEESGYELRGPFQSAMEAWYGLQTWIQSLPEYAPRAAGQQGAP